MWYVRFNESARIARSIEWCNSGKGWLFAAEDVPAFWVEDLVGFAGHFYYDLITNTVRNEDNRHFDFKRFISWGSLKGT
jgi:hypothetical protein